MNKQQRPHRVKYYCLICMDCDLITAIGWDAINTGLRPRLHTPHQQSVCPFCQTAKLQKKTILPDEYDRIDNGWDLTDMA